MQRHDMKTKLKSDHVADDSPGVVVMPPGVFLALLILGAILEWFLPPSAFAPTMWELIVGVVIILAGFVFMMWGHGRFKTLGVNVKTILPASRLVTDGAYRFSRNPMYVGFVTMTAGFGIALASVWICAMSLPYLIYFSLYVIPREESYLARRFGAEYDSYRKRVRRWL